MLAGNAARSSLNSLLNTCATCSTGAHSGTALAGYGPCGSSARGRGYASALQEISSDHPIGPVSVVEVQIWLDSALLTSGVTLHCQLVPLLTQAFGTQDVGLPEVVFASPVIQRADVRCDRLSIWRIRRTVLDQEVMSGALQVGLISFTPRKST